MKQIYVVREKEVLLLACESRSDAIQVVENIYGKSAKAIDEHIARIPYAENSIQVLDYNAKQDILNVASTIACQIATTLSEKFIGAKNG